MRLNEFLSQNPLPSFPEDFDVGETNPDDVQLTGRIEGADDQAILVRLGDALVRVARDDVVDVEPDPARPLIEPGAVYARLRVRASAKMRVETVVSAAALAGAGMRPMVAAQASLAPLYAVRRNDGFVPLVNRQLVYPAAGNRPWQGAPAAPGPWHTLETTYITCPHSTVAGNGTVSTDWTDDYTGADAPIDEGPGDAVDF
jgi:hypothetical protein